MVNTHTHTHVYNDHCLNNGLARDNRSARRLGPFIHWEPYLVSFSGAKPWRARKKIVDRYPLEPRRSPWAWFTWSLLSCPPRGTTRFAWLAAAITNFISDRTQPDLTFRASAPTIVVVLSLRVFARHTAANVLGRSGKRSWRGVEQYCI